jgi:hypothetical protein
MSTIHPARSPRGDSRPSSVSATGSARLAAYLAAGVGASMVGTPDAEAAVVAIDLTNLGSGINVTGANAGLASPGFRVASNWLGANTGTLSVYRNSIGPYWGLGGSYGLQFALSTPGFAKPRNFGAGTLIDTNAVFTTVASQSSFKWSTFYTSPDFGANSFMGFRFGSGSSMYYGYLAVTWTSSSDTFQILSGAYESTVNTGILAGATPVPAPSALALLALGGGAFRRARARAA